ncbi:MAG: T9SS type A sorting domain-containing protein, partial [Pontibacter sp.]|nr:T9SS type A sorting domain-containing protein [Pontibacter sp.]
GTVAGAGSTAIQQHYVFVDTEPHAGMSYYRLKQVDFDGQFSYSNVVGVRLKETNAQDRQLKVWPNPFDDELATEIYTSEAKEVQLILSDMNGRSLYTKTIKLKAGVNRISLALQELPKGMYILRLQGMDVSESAKVIKR